MNITIGAAIAGAIAVGLVGLAPEPAAALPIPTVAAAGPDSAVITVSSWGQRVQGRRFRHRYGYGYGYGYRPRPFYGYGYRPYGYGYRRHFRRGYYGVY